MSGAENQRSRCPKLRIYDGLFILCTIYDRVAMRYLATEFVSAGASGPHRSKAFVCICARFFGVFFRFWVCMDTERGSQLPAANDGVENDGCSQITVETTLALIKPDAVERSAEIEDIIARSGFSVLRVSATISLAPTQGTCIISPSRSPDPNPTHTANPIPIPNVHPNLTVSLTLSLTRAVARGQRRARPPLNLLCPPC